MLFILSNSPTNFILFSFSKIEGRVPSNGVTVRVRDKSAVGIASFCSGDCVLFKRLKNAPQSALLRHFPRPLQNALDTVDEVGIVATRRPLRLLLIPNGAASPLDTVAEKEKEKDGRNVNSNYFMNTSSEVGLESLRV